MSLYIADEVSIRIDWSAFTTVGNRMPPRDPDEEDDDDENERKRTALMNPRSCGSPTKTKGARACRLLALS